jgi:hypothetical protein
MLNANEGISMKVSIQSDMQNWPKVSEGMVVDANDCRLMCSSLSSSGVFFLPPAATLLYSVASEMAREKRARSEATSRQR